MKLANKSAIELMEPCWSRVGDKLSALLAHYGADLVVADGDETHLVDVTITICGASSTRRRVARLYGDRLAVFTVARELCRGVALSREGGER